MEIYNCASSARFAVLSSTAAYFYAATNIPTAAGQPRAAMYTKPMQARRWPECNGAARATRTAVSRDSPKCLRYPGSQNPRRFNRPYCYVPHPNISLFALNCTASGL